MAQTLPEGGGPPMTTAVELLEFRNVIECLAIGLYQL